ncbi:MAG TPA: hypothetical protein VMR21_13865 [Vicinamibacteria bacterium]|nr:hypothetical protein [Vicinamibacteria bacterium]
MLRRVKLVALAGVVASAALLPLYGDPRNSAVTHAEWARMLLRALDLSDGPAQATTASEAFAVLSWKESLRFRADRYAAADEVSVERGPGPARVVPTAEVGEVSYPLSVVRGGDYRIRVEIAGRPESPASAELSRVGEVKPAEAFTVVPAADMGWVDAGTTHLDPGAYEATVLLPRGTTLQHLEVAPPCLDAVEPPGGWRATKVLETEDAAVTMVQALDAEAELPPAASPVEFDAALFVVDAATPSLVAGTVPGPGGVWVKAGPAGLRAFVSLDLPEAGLYTISVFGVVAGGQSWTADACRKSVVCASRAADESDLPQWRPVMTGEFVAGRHSLSVRLGSGAAVQRVRAERKKDSPADYAATLRRLGFDVGPPGPMGRDRAVDAMNSLERRITPLRATLCGDLVLPPEIPALRAGLEVAQIPGPAQPPPNAGPGQPPLGAGPVVPVGTPPPVGVTPSEEPGTPSPQPSAPVTSPSPGPTPEPPTPPPSPLATPLPPPPTLPSPDVATPVLPAASPAP